MAYAMNVKNKVSEGMARATAEMSLLIERLNSRVDTSLACFESEVTSLAWRIVDKVLAEESFVEIPPHQSKSSKKPIANPAKKTKAEPKSVRYERLLADPSSKWNRRGSKVFYHCVSVSDRNDGFREIVMKPIKGGRTITVKFSSLVSSWRVNS